MANHVEKMIDKRVNVITIDGGNFIGTLCSFDQKTNIILQDCVERMYPSASKEMAEVALGVYFIRGDNVAVIGEIDTQLDESIDYSKIKAAPIKKMLIH
jgi:U6 snRNA-associated Sm-like protein LSm8